MFNLKLGYLESFPPRLALKKTEWLMKVTYDIVRIEGDIEVTEDVPQSDLDLIAEAEKMEWGQIAFRHMEDEAQTEWAKERIHSICSWKYHSEERRCGLS